MNLNDYLLVKAFESAKYRDQFNNGDIYLSSTTKYWKLENAFQQDREGGVFQQEGKGFLLKTNGSFPKILANSSTVDDVLKNLASESAGEVLAETADFSLRLEGYLCCFYLLPKSAISFTQSTLSITSEQELKDITEFLNRYLSESQTHDFYVSIYDAAIFCNIFFKAMNEKGYKIAYGQVEYKDIDEATKVALYQKGDGYSILFTKPTKYSYQKEFRIFLSKPNEPAKDHVTENGIDVEKSRFGSLDYAYLCPKSNPKGITTDE